MVTREWAEGGALSKSARIDYRQSVRLGHAMGPR